MLSLREGRFMKLNTAVAQWRGYFTARFLFYKQQANMIENQLIELWLDHLNYRYQGHDIGSKVKEF